MKVRHIGRLLGIFLSVGLCWTCQKPTSVQMERLDESLFAAKTPAAMQRWLQQHATFARQYFGVTDPATDTSLVAELVHRINDPALNVLRQQAQTAFADGQLARQLGEAFTNIQKEFPSFKPPRVQTVITGFMGPDLVVTDSVVIVGLDYFAGPAANYRPVGPAFPQYILRRYAPAYVAPAIVLGLSKRFNKLDPADQTLLADMVFYGKSFVFARTMLPDTPDSLLIGYTDRQLTDAYAGQPIIWAHFIDKKLLYDTSPGTKERYVDERPFTSEIGQACPGAIGRWLGWRIVGRYQQETGASIQDIMAQPNARVFLEKSGYHGQPDEDDT